MTKPLLTKPARVIRFIIAPACPGDTAQTPSDGHTRRTSIANTSECRTIAVEGGDETLHERNVALAKDLAKLPRRNFRRNVRRLIRAQS